MTDPAAPSRSTTLAEHVCLAVRAARARTEDAPFLLRRGAHAVNEAGGAIGAALARALRETGGTDSQDPSFGAVAELLIRAGGALETAGEHAAARLVFELASELRPDCATTRLHAGRAARQSGNRDVALAHYTHARSLDAGGRIARLARIGEAMVSPAGERRLSEEIRSAVRAGDREAAGVGLEARALMRCETDRCREAIRDLCVCALRYPDREDQARAAERVAALLVQANDLEAAREALLLVHEIGTLRQRASARAKLHRVSVLLGDTLGARRWNGGTIPEVALPNDPAAAPPTRGVPLPVLRDWRDAVERTAGAR